MTDVYYRCEEKQNPVMRGVGRGTRSPRDQERVRRPRNHIAKAVEVIWESGKLAKFRVGSGVRSALRRQVSTTTIEEAYWWPVSSLIC